MSTEQASQEAVLLLDKLKDIHIPDAYAELSGEIHTAGIILAALLFAGLAGLIVRYYYLKTRTRRYALKELELMQLRFAEHGQHQRLLNELNTLLRRMAMINYEREKVAPLSGEHWLSFLDRSGQTQNFSGGAGQILANAYQPSLDSFDENALIEVIQQWIKRQL